MANHDVNITKQHKSKHTVVIVAAGRGERAGGLQDGPKQYRTIGSKSVIEHTLITFLAEQAFSHIVIVLHADDADLLQESMGHLLDDARITTTIGGKTRQQSVALGLFALEAHGPDTVLIHDAVRPFVSHDILANVINALEGGERAVLPAVPVADTLKRASSELLIEQTVSREHLYAAQTPQGFHFSDILAAHRQAQKEERDDFTDDCAIAEWAGLPVKIVEGSAKNVKLTTKEDIEMAGKEMGQHMPDVRCGNGYDVHQLVPGDGVILCGIHIPHNKSLSGHSDADVALHALTDALLATCGEGDIGDHFPPSDPQWKGAASYIFLEKAVEIVTSHGGTITNADVSLIAEQPKIGPHREIMRKSLAKILGIDLVRCSVKATTNEKIGFIGREEGIAAIATATVVYGS